MAQELRPAVLDAVDPEEVRAAAGVLRVQLELEEVESDAAAAWGGREAEGAAPAPRVGRREAGAAHGAARVGEGSVTVTWWRWKNGSLKYVGLKGPWPCHLSHDFKFFGLIVIVANPPASDRSHTGS